MVGLLKKFVFTSGYTKRACNRSTVINETSVEQTDSTSPKLQKLSGEWQAMWQNAMYSIFYAIDSSTQSKTKPTRRIAIIMTEETSTEPYGSDHEWAPNLYVELREMEVRV